MRNATEWNDLNNALSGTGTSYARTMSIFKIYMFILIHFTNLALQNAAKQGITKYNLQKFLSNNAISDISVIKSLPPPQLPQVVSALVA